MRIKELFTVPEGEKVTEKMFTKVLISSVCSMLLCMACLAGTTWAWFTVSVENAGNVIQIASVTADVSICDKNNNQIQASDGNYNLEAGGEYTLTVSVDNEGSNPVYVLMAMTEYGSDTPEYYYFEFSKENNPQTITIKENKIVKLNFSVSWVKPSAIPVGYDTELIGDAQTESTEAAETVTEATTGETTESTEESTGASTEATAEASTEAATEVPTEVATEVATETATE